MIGVMVFFKSAHHARRGLWICTAQLKGIGWGWGEALLEKGDPEGNVYGARKRSVIRMTEEPI